MYTIILNSRNRVNTTTTANHAQFYIDWSSILKEGKYRVKYSICKQSLTAQIPWLFRVKSLTATVPLIVDGTPLTNINNVAMVNDPIRGFVFNFLGNNCLSINVRTPVNSTKTFWVMMPNVTVNANNVYSSNKMPIWFSNTTFLRASVNFFLGDGGDVISTVELTAGVWKFYALTTTASQSKSYVDGNLVTTGNLTWGGDTDIINFGAYLGTSFLTGRLDDMRLYSQTLTAIDTNDLYARTLI